MTPRLLLAAFLVACAGCSDHNEIKPGRARAEVVTVDGTPRVRISFTTSGDDGHGLKVVREYQVLRSHDPRTGFAPFASSEIVRVSRQVVHGKKAKTIETRRRTIDDTSALPGTTYYYQVWAIAEQELGNASQAGAFAGYVTTNRVTLPGSSTAPPGGLEQPHGAVHVSAAPPDEDDGRHIQIAFELSPDDAAGRRLPLDGYVVLRSRHRDGGYIPILGNRKPHGVPAEVPVDPVASEARARYLVDLLGANAVVAPVDQPALRDLVKNHQVRRVTPAWEPDPDAEDLQPVILREIVGSAPPDQAPDRHLHVADALSEAGPFYYRVYTVPTRGDAVYTAVARPVSPRTSWFSTDKLNMAILLGAAFLLTLVFVQRAQTRGHEMFIRRIAGIDALEEAVGRATEMGRPILYVPGIDEIQNIQTIASLLILGRVAELVARYDSQIRVPCCIPIVATVAEEVVRQGFYNAGRPDQHRPQNIQWISSEQFAFCAGTNGIMLRDKPATNIFLGRFFGESLILAETGYVNKAIQIGGTAEITQLPFFIAACDYAIIGEELFAISAYMTREPKLLGSLKAADWVKAGILAVIAVTAIGGLVAWTGAPLSGTMATLAGWGLRLVGFLAPGT